MEKTIVSGCDHCPAHHVGNLKKLGIDMQSWDYVVALAGNPNTGKSTVFNALTGLRQHTGNWPGKTVTRAEGGFKYNDKHYKLIDLPGTYSLLSTSTDEEIARNFLLFGRPDVTVIVVDATLLERNLNLVLQILEISDRVVLCLNLMDEVHRNQLVIDERQLAKELGIPIVPTAARQKKGLDLLLKAISEVARGLFICKCRRIQSGSKKLQQAINHLAQKIEDRYQGINNARWIALRLLEGDSRIIESLRNDELRDLAISFPAIETANPL